MLILQMITGQMENIIVELERVGASHMTPVSTWLASLCPCRSEGFGTPSQ